jgi:hypothetical protein
VAMPKKCNLKLYVLKISKRFLYFIIFSSGTLFLVFLLIGYKIPESDKYPDWGTFPKHTNSRIKIKSISDSYFGQKYGNRYYLPGHYENDPGAYFNENYKQNLKNFKTVDFRVTNNELVFGDGYSIGPVYGNIQLNSRELKYYIRFFNSGDEYLQMSIGSIVTHFKIKKSDGFALECFYQYNYPTNETDTLFFHYTHYNYMAYVVKNQQ